MKISLAPLAVIFLFLAAPLQADKLTLVAGGGSVETTGAPAIESKLYEPFGVEFTRDGSMWIVEMASSNRLLRRDASGLLHILTAKHPKADAGDGGPVEQAKFNGMHNLAITPEDEVLLADTWNYRIRRLDPRTLVISNLAGVGKKGFGGDGGSLTAAQFGSVIQIALDAARGHLYVADIDNRRVRRLALKSGTVETVAGNGAKGAPTDGAVATEAPLVDPRAVTPDGAGGFYILERGGHALRHVDAKGVIRTVVGTGKQGLSGDGGPAREATLNGPKHLCMDRDGTVLIADAENHVIRRFDPKNGMITRVAGTGKKGKGAQDGDPLQTALNRPHGVTIGPDGLLYIVDSYNDRILKLEP